MPTSTAAMALASTHVADCQQHYSSTHDCRTSNDGSPLTSEMTSQTAGNGPESDGFTKKSDSGVYFAMMLSEYLDKQAMQDKHIPRQQPAGEDKGNDSNSSDGTDETTVDPSRHSTEPQQQQRPAKDETYAEAQAKEVVANLPNLIWVPAHKHPQIAPSEFVNWIAVHGEAPAARWSKVRRQKSKLSRSMSYNDVNEHEKDSSTTTSSSSSGEDGPTSPKDIELPPIEGKDGFSFATPIEHAPGLAPPTHHRTLLRRSALSARRTASEGSADRRRSKRTQQPSRHAVDTTDRMGYVPTEGVHLHDHPVSLSEWIDLGNANLESPESQHGILSRVHDAESQLLKIIDDNDNDSGSSDKEAVAAEQPAPATIRASPPAVDAPSLDKISSKASSPAVDSKSVVLRRSASDLTPQKTGKKISWIGALLGGDKKKRRSLRRTKNERGAAEEKDQGPAQLTRVSSMSAVSTTSRKRGWAALISRSLSMKSPARKESKKQQKETNLPPSTAASSVSTVASRHYIHSYRLPIHVERAIYRLSHMKLANPRRPLHQQVVISNFMFWYLSIINPQASQPTATNSSNTQWANDGGEAAFRATASSRPSKSLPKKYDRRASVSSSGSSDEDDNVPLSLYRK